MKKAYLILDEFVIGEFAAYKHDQSACSFIHQIKMATNEGAELSQKQENFLHGLISTYLSNDGTDITQAANVATWINSCH